MSLEGQEGVKVRHPPGAFGGSLMKGDSVIEGTQEEGADPFAFHRPPAALVSNLRGTGTQWGSLRDKNPNTTLSQAP